jgi:hypothetical protein
MPWAAMKEYKGNEEAADTGCPGSLFPAPRAENWMEEERMSRSLWSYFDPVSAVVIALTLVLFVVALFVNGFTHDLLQECGVFLVSVKLIVMSHKNGVSARHAEEQLEKIQNLLRSTREQGA